MKIKVGIDPPVKWRRYGKLHKQIDELEYGTWIEVEPEENENTGRMRRAVIVRTSNKGEYKVKTRVRDNKLYVCKERLE